MSNCRLRFAFGYLATRQHFGADNSALINADPIKVVDPCPDYQYAGRDIRKPFMDLICGLAPMVRRP
jgi:hypothetical protein